MQNTASFKVLNFVQCIDTTEYFEALSRSIFTFYTHVKLLMRLNLV